MKKRKAFTLIELLIVIAIIAILAIIIIMNLINARDKANYVKAKSDVKTIDDALMVTVADGAVYGDFAQGGMTISAFMSAQGNAGVDKFKKVIGSNVPTQPSGWTSSFYVVVQPTNGIYQAFIYTPKNNYTTACMYENGNVKNNDNCQP